MTEFLHLFRTQQRFDVVKFLLSSTVMSAPLRDGLEAGRTQPNDRLLDVFFIGPSTFIDFFSEVQPGSAIQFSSQTNTARTIFLLDSRLSSSLSAAKIGRVEGCEDESLWLL